MRTALLKSPKPQKKKEQNQQNNAPAKDEAGDGAAADNEAPAEPNVAPNNA